MGANAAVSNETPDDDWSFDDDEQDNDDGLPTVRPDQGHGAPAVGSPAGGRTLHDELIQEQDRYPADAETVTDDMMLDSVIIPALDAVSLPQNHA